MDDGCFWRFQQERRANERGIVAKLGPEEARYIAHTEGCYSFGQMRPQIGGPERDAAADGNGFRPRQPAQIDNAQRQAFGKRLPERGILYHARLLAALKRDLLSAGDGFQTARLPAQTEAALARQQLMPHLHRDRQCLSILAQLNCAPGAC